MSRAHPLGTDPRACAAVHSSLRAIPLGCASSLLLGAHDSRNAFRPRATGGIESLAWSGVLQPLLSSALPEAALERNQSRWPARLAQRTGALGGGAHGAAGVSSCSPRRGAFPWTRRRVARRVPGIATEDPPSAEFGRRRPSATALLGATTGIARIDWHRVRRYGSGVRGPRALRAQGIAAPAGSGCPVIGSAPQSVRDRRRKGPARGLSAADWQDGPRELGALRRDAA